MNRYVGFLLVLGLGIGSQLVGCGSSDPVAESGESNEAAVTAEVSEGPDSDGSSSPSPDSQANTASEEAPAERSVAVELVGKKSVKVYEAVQLAVEKADSRSEIRFLTLPEGMVYEEGNLQWTPASDQVGIHKIQARVKNGDLRHEYDFQIDVVRTPVDVPFAVRKIALSSDGDTAFVWGASKGRPRGFHEGVTIPVNQMALVDVEKHAVKSAGESARDIANAWMTPEHVYIVLNNSEKGYPVEIQQLDAGDLSLVKSIKTQSAPEQREVKGELLGDTLLLVENEKFQLPELIPTESPDAKLEKMFTTRRSNQHATATIEELIWHEGIYWDHDLATAKLLSHPARFIQAGRNSSNSNSRRSRNLWGGRMEDGNLLNADGKEVLKGNRFSLRLTPLTNLPAVCRFRPEVRGEGRQEQVEITIHRVDNGEMTQKLVLGNVSSDDYPDFACAGPTIAACCDGQLHLISESEIDSKPLPLLFRIGISQTLAIKAKGTTKVNYKILDGAPPYQLELTIGKQTFSASCNEDATVSVQAESLGKEVSDVAVQTLYQYVGSQGDPRERVLDYIEYVTPLFRKLTGRDPKGVPVVVPAKLTVTDAQLRSDELNHMFLMELPLREIGMHVENRVAGSRERSTNQQRGYGIESVVQGRSSRERKAGSRAALDKAISKNVAEEYRNSLLRKNPPEDAPTDQLDQLAAAALEAVNKPFEKVLAKRKATLRGGIRRWTSSNGHSTKAMLQSVFAEQVVLRSPEGKEMTLPLEKLSEKDQEFVKQYLKASTDNRPTEYLPTQLQAQLAGIKNHKSKKYRYPPAFLTDPSGQPTLSWRVLILPYIGGEELFELFRFDEPWDSPHNRRLLSFMPAMYKSLDAQVDAGKTTILALRGTDTILSNATPRSSSDKVDSLSSIPLLLEVKPEKAIEWTRPEDLSEESFADIPDWLLSRDEKTFVGMADSKVKMMSASLSPSQWQQGINCTDGEEPDYSVAESSTQLAIATKQPQSTSPKKSPRRTVKRQRKVKLERISPKKFILGKAQPDQSLIGEPKKLDGGFEVRSLPFDCVQGSRTITCVVSPQGTVFGFKQDALIELDPLTGKIKKQAKLTQGASSIYWSDGMLILTRRTTVVEQSQFSGEWRRVEGQPDRALPSRQISVLQAWTVDPKTFKVKRGFELPGNWLSCAADSSNALLMAGRSSVERIGLVNLRRGELLSMQPPLNENGEKNRSSDMPDNLKGAVILPDGESGIVIDDKRLYRLDFTGGQLSFSESSKTMHLANDFQSRGFEISSDGQFVGVGVSNSKDKRLRGKSGFLFYSTENIKQPYGALPVYSDSYQGPSLLTLDSDSKTVIFGGNQSGELRVFQNENRRDIKGLAGRQGYSLRPQRLLVSPNSDTVIVLGEQQSFLVTVDGKAEQWAFQPASDEVELADSGLAAKTPKEPLRFVESEKSPGEMILDSDPSYDVAAFSPDGRYLYLQEFYEGIISCFDTKSYRELRRYTYESSSDSPISITKLGVLVYFPDDEEFHLLDFKTLDGKSSFSLEEVVAMATAPGSPHIVTRTKHGDLRVNDIASGKLITELSLEEQMKWEADDNDRRSRNTPSGLVSMSPDGKNVLIGLRQNHVLRLSGNKFKYLCKAPTAPPGNRYGGPGFDTWTSVFSPNGKFLAEGGGANNSEGASSKVFQIPKMANAASITRVGNPIAVDDEGRIYGTTEEGFRQFNQRRNNANVAVFDLQGKQVYREPENIRSRSDISQLLLQPGRPGHILIDAGGNWHFVDTNKQHER